MATAGLTWNDGWDAQGPKEKYPIPPTLTRTTDGPKEELRRPDISSHECTVDMHPIAAQKEKEKPEKESRLLLFREADHACHAPVITRGEGAKKEQQSMQTPDERPDSTSTQPSTLPRPCRVPKRGTPNCQSDSRPDLRTELGTLHRLWSHQGVVLLDFARPR